MTMTENRNGGRRGFLLDFRDEFGYSSVDCSVCGSPAAGWDVRSGTIFHYSSAAFGGQKPPCYLKDGL